MYIPNYKQFLNEQMSKKESLVIAVDFDGTVVTHDFPKVGKDVGAIPVLTALVNAGHKLVLFTMRSDITEVKSEDYNIHKEGGNYLTQAVNWFNDNGIKLYGVNRNPDQDGWTSSPKAYAQMYIDDMALGAPLKYDYTISDKPFIDWKLVSDMLVVRGIL